MNLSNECLNRKKTSAITISILLVTSVFMLLSFTTVQAQDVTVVPPAVGAVPDGETPSVIIETIPYISFRPNPVGVNQVILVNLWVQPPTHYSRYLSGLSVTFTKPDGTQDVFGPMDSYQGDATAWFEYTVDQVGEWKIRFDFPGNYYEGRMVPPGFMESAPRFLDSAYYAPSTTGDLTLTVQEDIVYSWPESPLPTDYWTRPVSPENREWVQILGDYPYLGYMANPPAGTNRYANNYKFTPYVQGPNTAHVAWKREGAISGLMGGDMGTRLYGSGEGTYAGTPSIIFEGRAYQSLTKAGGEDVLQCYDIRTGEIYWEIPNPVPGSQGWFGYSPGTLTAIDYNAAGEAVPGATQSQVGSGASLVAITGGNLNKYNPYTGAQTMSVSIAPLTTGTIYNTPYALSVQNLGGGKYRLIEWSIAGTTQDFASRVISNVTWPFSSIGTADYEAKVAVTTQSISSNGAGITIGNRLIGVSLTTGDVIWNVTTDLSTAHESIYSTSTACADHGKYAVRMNDGYWHCWSLTDGTKLWKSEMSSWPWGSWGGYNVASAYGMLYYMQYDGVVAYDWDTGEIIWHYSAGDAGYETPYGTWSFFTNAIVADGKVYIANGEHSPTSPLTRGWKLHCINAFTGDGIWNFTSGGAPGAIADGYLTFDSRYTGYMYVFGKGESATTITAPQTSVPKGTTMMITGSVLDQSPAQPDTPCVSAASMSTQMDYLHMQKPIPDGYTVTGVPVTLTAISSNGDCFEIGTVTTSGYYGTYGLAWTPTEEGTYEIIASFGGDDSYGSSGASTFVNVGPAASAGGPISAEEQPFISTEVAIVLAVVAIAVIGAVAYVVLRKRK